MQILSLVHKSFLLMVVFHAQGALISPTKKHYSTRTTVSPNDVIEPAVHRPSPPIKQSSSRTDMLVGALSVTSALIPYLNYFTDFLSKGQAEEVKTPPAPIQNVVTSTDNVSRNRRENTEEAISEEVLDTFIGSVLGPFGVAVEIANILIDVLAFTQAEGLTDPITLPRGKRDLSELYQHFNFPENLDLVSKNHASAAQVNIS